MVPPGVPATSVDDFVNDLRLNIEEEGGIWELTWKSSVVLQDRTETRDPWPQEACAWALRRWLDAGLIGLYRLNTSGPSNDDLTTDEARAVLADATSWRPEFGVCLFPTDDGASADDEHWRAILDDANA
jgi:hypothetical protein